VYYTLYQEGIWDILYEHYSYFSPSSLEYVFKRNGFRVDRVAETFGEQFLTIEAAPVKNLCRQSSRDERLKRLGAAAATFASIYQRKVDHWQSKSMPSGAKESGLLCGAPEQKGYPSSIQSMPKV
jgi:hypothetical protein